jgi:hypothetical protein
VTRAVWAHWEIRVEMIGGLNLELIALRIGRAEPDQKSAEAERIVDELAETMARQWPKAPAAACHNYGVAQVAAALRIYGHASAN